MTDTEIEWRDPEPGFEFQPDEVVITAEHQQEKLKACGLGADVFGDRVDASFYIGAGIHAGIRSGISAEGNVNMLSRLHQHRPVLLGETLIVKGFIRAVTEVPRGHTVDTEVWFEGEDGERAISVPRKSLKPDPTKSTQRGAGDRPPPVFESMNGLAGFGRYALTPDQVKQYSMEGNSIHYEMDAAVRAGFRAPIIGGGMGVHYLVHTMQNKLKPTAFDMDIYFRRPIFWDDEFNVRVDVADGNSDDWRAICLAREGKVLTEARINSLSL